MAAGKSKLRRMGCCFCGGGAPGVLEDAAPLAPTRTLEGSADVLSVSFSPDGRLLLSGAYDALTVWDVATGEALARCVRSPGGAREEGGR